MTGQVMHGRLWPRHNHFRYGIYYLVLPLSALDALPIAHNASAAMSFHDNDHGYGTTGTLKEWAQNILRENNIFLDGEIVLVCMPRILGYVFNPVSFWLCHDASGALKAVLCEVHNTFGEKHTYLCAHADNRSISPDDTMTARKVFHVSPFLQREGRYDFRFESSEHAFKAWINYFDEEGRQILVTSLAGRYALASRKVAFHMFWKYPLVTFRTIFLIHYQALLLLMKGVRYIPKPSQNPETISTTTNLTKI